MDINNFHKRIEEHYSNVWGSTPTSHCWNEGPIHDLPKGFQVLRFEPSKSRGLWTYATCGMSLPSDPTPLELHIFAPKKNDDLVLLLTVVAHYHRTGSSLGYGHTVNFGQPWWKESNCCYGLISLPYLDGPSLEWLVTDGIRTQFLWLIPVTEKEIEFKKEIGLEALEEKFDNPGFNYADPFRKSMIW